MCYKIVSFQCYCRRMVCAHIWDCAIFCAVLHISAICTFLSRQKSIYQSIRNFYLSPWNGGIQKNVDYESRKGQKVTVKMDFCEKNQAKTFDFLCSYAYYHALTNKLSEFSAPSEYTMRLLTTIATDYPLGKPLSTVEVGAIISYSSTSLGVSRSLRAVYNQDTYTLGRNHLMTPTTGCRRHQSQVCPG